MKIISISLLFLLICYCQSRHNSLKQRL